MKIFSGVSRAVRALRQLHEIFLSEKRGLVIAYYVATTTAATLPFVQSFALGVWTNGLLQGDASRALFLAVCYGCVLVCIDSVWDVQGYLNRTFWMYFDRQTRYLFAHKLASFDLATIEDPDFQNKKTKNDENLYRVQNFVDRQYYIIQNVLEVGFAMAVLAWAQWWLALVMVAAMIPNFIVIGTSARLEWGIWGARADIRKWYQTIIHYFYEKHALLEMVLMNSSHPMLVRAFEYYDVFYRETRMLVRRVFSKTLAANGAQGIGYIVCFIVLANQVLSGALELGMFVFFVGSMATLRNALGGLAQNLGRQYEDSLHVQDLLDFFAFAPRITSGHHRLALHGHPPRIEFRHVSFKYAHGRGSVVHDINIIIEPGQKIALVGLNGAGKSTFIKLLCRFYDPTQGQILVNGEDLRTLDLGYWHAQLATIFQEYPRYQLTASDAIAMGRGLEVDAGKIEKAAIAAEADEFIRTWKPGYDQILSVDFDGGIDPSLGQWQRIAVARALYRDAPILILDEPTSSVDAQAEQKIFDMLSGLPRSKTVILISHRFSTVRHADKIVVLDGGTIAEQGTHNELMKLGGTYARLFALQAKGYTMT